LGASRSFRHEIYHHPAAVAAAVRTRAVWQAQLSTFALHQRLRFKRVM
jgi:hypothetical protein